MINHIILNLITYNSHLISIHMVSDCVLNNKTFYTLRKYLNDLFYRS